MFCSACGAKAVGKFCSGCGAKLHAVDGGGQRIVEPPIDWSDWLDYEQLISLPAVRDRIARAAAQSKKKMTGEDFLDLYGKALGKMAGVPLPMSTIAHFAQSMHAKLGIKTGKSHSQTLPTTPGETIVALLCSLARHGRAIRDVRQLTDGCVITASLPSDLLALEGELVIAVSRQASGTRVDAHTDIPGQMFDWGKSTRCLESLFGELSMLKAA